MNRNDSEEIKALKQEIEDLKRQLEKEKEENLKLRDQLPDSSNRMKPSIKRALAQAGPEAGGGDE
jgi:regulator of replication initiation timing